MNRQEITLDVSKRGPAPEVHVRQGDRNGTVLAVRVLRNGEPADLEGWDANLCVKLGDGALFLASGEVSGSVAEFLLDERLMGGPGRAQLAYAEIEKGETRCSTQGFALVVEPSGRSLQ